jgi:hypothetical protein
MKFYLLLPIFIIPVFSMADEYHTIADQSAVPEQVTVTKSSGETAEPALSANAPHVEEYGAKGKIKIKRAARRNANASNDSTLPEEYFRKSGPFVAGDKSVYTSVKKVSLNGMLRGVKFEAVINEAISVSQTVTNPVSGLIVSGEYAGSTVVGDARLDKDLHRVLIDFTFITLKDKRETYSFKGAALGEKGIGLYGDYHTQSGMFLIGEFASAAAAGFSDAQIDRSTTLSGGYIAAPTVSNAAMSGLTASLSKTSDKFAQGAAGMSDHTDTDPYQKISVIVTEEPVLKE